MTYRDESGFTLPELIISISIIGIIMASLAGAMIVIFKNVDKTNAKLSDSRSAQISSAYFTTDIQSADSVSYSQPKCGAETSSDNTSAVGVSAFLKTTSNGETVRYYVLKKPSGERLLKRQRTPSSGPVDTAVISHTLAGCGANGANDGAVAIYTSGSKASPVPPFCMPTCTNKKYTLDVTVHSQDVGGDDYSFKLTGETRVQ